MRTIALAAVLAAVSFSGAGCGKAFEAPDGYVMLPSPSYYYRAEAVSADGVYLGLREARASEEGDLAFWTKAVRNEVEQGRGYVFVSEAETRSADGTAGKRMEFTANLQGREFGYLVALWVTGKEVHVAEAGGAKEKFDVDRGKLEKALGTVRLK